MDFMDFLSNLIMETPSKIVLLVLDGVGGLPHPETGLTELEQARTPNLDALSESSILGFVNPIEHGITPGSGPSHLALFGYDPIRFEIGRGALSAAGVDFPQGKNDLAGRMNYATIDAEGKVTDRRAGRIPTETCVKLCKELSDKVSIPGVQLFVIPEAEHRAALVFRGEGLKDRLTDSDPQVIGEKPLEVKARDSGSEKAAQAINEFIRQAGRILADHHPANMVLLRGFSVHPDLPSINELYRLKSAAIANYPMYRGVGRLVGMDVLETGSTIENEFATLAENISGYTFFYLHVKKTDSYGEDGDYSHKVGIIEEVDRHIPALLDLKPDVIAVTGDHSTPWSLKSHSWHPVPFMIHSAHCRPDEAREFSERGCARGALGTIYTKHVMSLLLANALKLKKYGA